MTEQPVAPAPAAPAPTAPTAEPDWKAEAARLQAERDEWKGHARDWEGRAKANKQAADGAAQRDALIAKVAETLGLEGAKPDPEAIARELASTRASAAQMARENQVLLAAAQAGANPTALLDSRAFARQLEGIDPSDRAAISAAVKAAVEADPRFAATPATPAAPVAPPPAPPAPAASTASSFNGSPGGARQLTHADVRNMTGAQLSKANRDGLLRDYFATPNQ